MFFILFTAFIGGIILNIMPCVFPVLSIKVLSFVEHGGSSQRTARAHALAFTAGIVASFWILTILVLFLRSTGEKVGWGFQLQNPDFVAVLYMVLILIACNLFGVFEFGSTLQRIGGNLDRGRTDYTGSFLTGILTTVLATPCTAPFIGSAVAYALSGSFFENWLVFTSIALGLAAPYVLLSFFPIFLKYLPAPGAWMERFKQAMGFPILLTALWLLHVLESQTNPGTIIVLLLSSVGVLLAAWIFGITTHPRASKRMRHVGQLVSVTTLILAGLISIPTHSEARSDSGVQDQYVVDEYNQHWLHFSKDTINQQLQDGKPVFVDFTARWCVTCQVNKKLIFSSQEIRDLIKEKSIVLIRADWTRYDPVITDALKEHGKAGVPFNLLYIPNVPDPIEFPSLLTRSIIRESFENL
jgi:thiol:disulfide interchange protein